MDLRDYLKVVRHRWRVIVVSLLAVVAVASIVTFNSTPQYESRARLFVSTADRSMTEASQGGLFAMQRVSSYADLVKGQELVGRVSDELDLNMTPGALAKKISATVVPSTVILEVTATDSDPRTSQRIAQAVAEALTELVDQLETPPGKANAPIKASVVDSATLPSSPVSPQPLRNLILAIALGLLLGLGVAVLRELLDTSVEGSDDISQVTEAPVLGGILFDSNTPKDPLISNLPSHSPRVEAFRILRTNLQFIDVDRDKKVLVVTSSVREEGKTTTASNIALAMRDAGQRTLLIDGDMRRPQLADIFRLEGRVGLTTVLVGRVSLEEAVQVDGKSGLAVLTSGPVPPNPAELLQTNAMSELLDEARESFDIVIVDAPPLLPVTDAALIASQTDGAVVVVRQGKTTKDQLAHSLDRLQAVGARTLGITLNMVASRRGREKSYGGYGYGYGYASEEGPKGKARRLLPVNDSKA